MEDILNAIKKIQSIIDQNQDNRTKEIGDRVLVWDGSGNIDKNGKHRSGIDPLFKSPAIVIATNQSIIYSDDKMNSILGRNYDKICDLLLAFPSGEEVYCASQFVKIVQ